jgi:hypothetical protein
MAIEMEKSMVLPKVPLMVVLKVNQMAKLKEIHSVIMKARQMVIT